MRLPPVIATKAILGVFWLCSACASSNSHELDSHDLSPDDAMHVRGSPSSELATIQAMTLVPEVFSSTFPGQVVVEARQVPPQMVSLAEVKRPRAEVRTGPGTQFEVLDRLLQKSEVVLVFGSVGVWRRVLLPDTWQRGWVHIAALKSAQLNGKPMTIEMNQLPTVLATRAVNLAHRFPDLAAIRVNIPKGTMFRSLRSSNAGSLVWMPETNSVMWLAERDAQ